MIKRLKKKHSRHKLKSLDKTPSGINGLDEILGGGLPEGRPTLVCGSAGCGKSLFGIEFLVRGALDYDEPGVLITFEETEKDFVENVASLGFDLEDMKSRKQLAFDHIRLERSEIAVTGEFDLEGLFIRLNHAIDSLGAKRVVIDTVEAIFAGLPNESILRAELRRLFAWLKEKKVTSIITGEQGQGTLTRYGLEEYVADCVILLDHRVVNQISTRRLRVVKYRGSFHGTNEYPFLIGKDGISVLPITSLGLDHPASAGRVSSGIPRLDTMLGGKGYYRGGNVLVSGTAGSGKTTFAAAFVAAACRRKERSIYFAFEESQAQITRNMRSIGIDLDTYSRSGMLQIHAVRPTLYGLEMHLTAIHDLVRRIKPRMVVMDPITNLFSVGNVEEVKSMLTRLIDYFKNEQITALFTSLTHGGNSAEESQAGVSSLMDTWILLRNLEYAGERNRGLFVIKSRGMAHSNQIREFRLSRKGIELIDVYVGEGVVLTGSARVQQEARERAEARVHLQNLGRMRRVLEHKRAATHARIQRLKSNLEADVEEFNQNLAESEFRSVAMMRDRSELASKRMADAKAKLLAHSELTKGESV